MAGSPLKMLPVSPEDEINEGVCYLQNYGLGNELKGPDPKPPIVFYDYAFSQDWNIGKGDAVSDEQDAIEDSDMCVQLQLSDETQLNYAIFPERQPELDRPRFLRVIDFPKLQFCSIKNFPEAMIAQMKPEWINPEAAPISSTQEKRIGWEKMLGDLTKGLDVRGSFKAGISFRAFKKLDIMALMIRIPYFEVSKSSSVQPQESFGLPEYRSLVSGIPRQGGGAGSSGEQPLSNQEQTLVHQAWFIVFGHEMVAMLRSAEIPALPESLGASIVPPRPQSPRPQSQLRPQPLIPYQERSGSFHALVQMISNVFTSSRNGSLVHFSKAITKDEYNFQQRHKPKTIEEEEALEKKKSKKKYRDRIEEERRRIQLEDRMLKSRLITMMADITTLKSIIQSQVVILEDLRDVYENNFRSPSEKNCFNKVGVDLPELSRSREQIPPTFETIDKVIEERGKFEKKFDILLERAERLMNSLTLDVNQVVSEQQADIAERQLNFMSMFTIVTTIFLPLGFFASYYSISDESFSKNNKNERYFWSLCAPVTIGIAFLTFVVCFRKQGNTLPMVFLLKVRDIYTWIKLLMRRHPPRLPCYNK